MYPLDLETMLTMVKEYRRTGILSADLPAGVGGLRQAGWAEITLKSGVVVTCHILTATGESILEDQPALRALVQLGRLNWDLALLQEFSPATSSQITPIQESTSASAPRRVYGQLPSKEIASWSRQQRQVFALVDGNKTPEQIATILSLPVDKVKKTLAELQTMGMVLFS